MLKDFSFPVRVLILTVIATLLGACAVANGVTPSLVPNPTLKSTSSPILPSVTPTPGLTVTPSATSTLTHTPTATPTPSITLTPTLSPTATPDTRPLPAYWSSWPVIPTVSGRAIEIYRRGQELGNDPHSFTRVGDCQSIPEVFLGIYDTDRYWFSNDFGYLEATVRHFKGAFSRPNITARDGFSVLSVLSPLYADPKVCQSSETPLECEYRLNTPIIALISMGTNWKPGVTEKFEKNLRKITEFWIDHGVVPVLMTKADDIEGDNTLNRSIALVAYEYDVPMLNTWLAVQYLPNHGLQEDNVYLTPDAWDERAFTALVTLNRLWTTFQKVPPP